MGEARRRMEMGLKPGEQVQIKVDLKDADKLKCGCGGEAFMMCVNLYKVSALVSPTGQESIAQVPTLVCIQCQQAFKVHEGAEKS